jgi:hypothetical protein
MKIISGWAEKPSGQRRNQSAPSATRTRDLLLRRHNHPSAVQTSKHARHQRTKQPQAVALGTILVAGSTDSLTYSGDTLGRDSRTLNHRRPLDVITWRCRRASGGLTLAPARLPPYGVT